MELRPGYPNVAPKTPQVEKPEQDRLRIAKNLAATGATAGVVGGIITIFTLVSVFAACVAFCVALGLIGKGMMVGRDAFDAILLQPEREYAARERAKRDQKTVVVPVATTRTVQSAQKNPK